ncbi:Biopolymer transport protein ExbD/TolR [Croceitalea dokdonensis DOKDO 023]|uniref:Biopolymer transport protein ExbD/TolR n=1 Tax=Croceitalea dokdonensis DOKDO 023 TaxID=1300341 RepID=A0A0P7ATZ1_9FLAO|nr:biopolymer transporter ExbD [Croceitalea dokdonensis]KPM31303.1 Biopolymer transport protein ExbD/TolR [Croceitalea dokdonensis DOKDO 023]
MSFRKTMNREKIPQVSTASLPDIVFILLFFFMTVTVVKNTDYLVDYALPYAQDAEALAPPDRVIELIVGQPKQQFRSKWGKQARVQLNGKLMAVKDVGNFVLSELGKMPEYLQRVAVVSLKIDEAVPMGMVADLKEQLKNVQVYKIHYVTHEVEEP